MKNEALSAAETAGYRPKGTPLRGGELDPECVTHVSRVRTARGSSVTLVKIRPWKKEDAQNLSKALNNKKIHDNLRDGLPFPYTVSDAEAYISLMLSADSDKTYAWAITVDDIAVGSIGVFRKDNVHRLTAEMGYYVAEEYWGRGIMTEAVKQSCRYIFDNTDIVRIFADPYAFNNASCRVLEKAGFVYEGTLRRNAIKNGQFVDMKLYAIVKE